MTSTSPHTKDDLLRAFDQQEVDSLAYWNAFDTETFFRRIGPTWSPAETVRHLSKSTRPVVKALKMSRLLLRLLFGKARRASMSYEEFTTRYLQALAQGGQAGRFAPSAQSLDDRQAWRNAIMRDFTNVNAQLRDAVQRWPEGKLDRLQLPHPLLGKLTVREMLFFTLYHHGHHVAVVKRRLVVSA